MQLLLSVRVVVNIDGDPPSFFKTKQRSGKLSIVRNRRNDSLGRDLDRRGLDMQCVVRRCLILRPRAKGQEWKWKSRAGELYACNGPSSFEESAAGNPQRFHKQLLKATTRCWYTLE